MSITLKAYRQGDTILQVTELDAMLQSGGLLAGVIRHDTYLNPTGATHEQCLRVLAVAMLFHSNYGGDAGFYADSAGSKLPLAEGWHLRLRGPLPQGLLAGFKVEDNDGKHHDLALRVLRWLIAGHTENVP